jgi:hypothetical protein
VVLEVVPVAAGRLVVGHAPLVGPGVGFRVDLQLPARPRIGEHTDHIIVKHLPQGRSRIDDLLEHVDDRRVVHFHAQVGQQPLVPVAVDRCVQAAEIDGHPIRLLMIECSDDSLSTVQVNTSLTL